MKKKILAAVLAFAVTAGSVLGAVPAGETVLAAEKESYEQIPEVSAGEGVLTANPVYDTEATLELTELKGATEYEIQRKTGSGDFERVVTMGEAVLYSEDFEDATVESTDANNVSVNDVKTLATKTGQKAVYVEEDQAETNKITDTDNKKILRIGGDSDGTAGQITFEEPITENVKVALDIRLDGTTQGKTNSFALFGVPAEPGQRWIATNGGAKPQEKKPIFMLSAYASGNGQWEKVMVNEFPAESVVELDKDKAVISVPTTETNTENGTPNLKRDTTGWLHMEVAIDFASQKTDVVITRRSSGAVVYEGKLPFAYATEKLSSIFMVGDKQYGSVSVDNISITTERVSDQYTHSDGKFTYVDKGLTAGTSYTYRAVMKKANKTYVSDVLEVKTTSAAEALVAAKKALDDKITEAKELKESDYTAESWAKFNTALTDAKTEAGKENATVDSLTAAKTALEKAIKDLTEKPADPTKPAVTSIAVSVKDDMSTTLSEKGATITMVATVKPDDAEQTVEWESSNTNVATINAAGVVTAVSNGTTQITAKATDKSGKESTPVTVTVNIPDENIPSIEEIAIAAKDAEAGTTLTQAGQELEVIVKQITPGEAAGKEVEWASSKPEVATVTAKDGDNKTAVVKAVANGKTTITAKAKEGNAVSNGLEIEVKIENGETVIKVTNITITAADNKTKLTKAGESVQLTAAVAPETAANKAVTWASSNEAAAAVDANGLVMAKANGTAVITATAADGSGVKAEITITVEIANTDVNTEVKAASVTVTAADNKTKLTKAGETVQLTAAVAPDNATNKAVTWASSSAAASVDANGLVTAKANGTAVITATAADGSGVSGNITITVDLPKPTSEAKGKKLTDTKTKNAFVVTQQGMSDGTKAEVSFTKAGTKNTKLEVPATVKIKGVTYNVTSVGSKALTNAQKKKITSITLGKNVTKIEKNAFANCTKVTKVTLNNNLKEIGDSAFKGCTKLTKITIPGKVEKIGNNAFSGAKKLSSVTIKKGVKKIGKGAFEKCTSLKKITIPDKVTEIGDNAFKGDSKLETVTIGKDLTKIGANAFNGCTKLKTVTVNSTKLKTVGKNAFKGVKKTTKVKVPKSKVSAYKNKFKGLKVSAK